MRIKYQLKNRWKINPTIYDVNGTWFLPRLFKYLLYISFKLNINKHGRYDFIYNYAFIETFLSYPKYINIASLYKRDNEIGISEISINILALFK